MERKLNIRLAILLLILNYSSAQSCDYYQNIEVGKYYPFYSPNYANNYYGGTQCRWQAACPSGNNCRLDCDVDIPYTQGCTLDRLQVSKTGDPQLVAAETYCGQGPLSIVSTGQKISMALFSDTKSAGGKFRCQLSAQAASTPTCSCGYGRQNRIVGGSETGVNEFPMMVGLADVGISQIKCGAVIISNKHVLTAAHCLANRTINDFGVVVGEHDVKTGQDTSATQAFRIANINIHPQYNAANYDYDIAIVTIVGSITFSDRVGPVCLPFKFVNDDFTGKRVTVLGWGTTFIGGPVSNVLRKVDLDVISQSTCRSQVPSLTTRQMCTLTPGKDACQDDSGGPVLYTDPATARLFNIGIISYGRSCASGSPGINTRVTTLLNWILTNTPDANYCRV